jgi:hypothetical protein
MPFSLNERAVFALLVLSDAEVHELLSILEWITADPRGATTGVRMFQGGPVNVTRTASYEILFTVSRSGHVWFQEIWPK